MKRDMDLIRELLLKLETLPGQPHTTYMLDGSSEELARLECGADEINFHLSLLQRAGFVETCSSQPAIGITFTGLSWSGYDFLDATRDKTVWEKTKDTASRAGGFSVDLLVGIAKEIIKQNVAKLTGGAFGL